MKPRVVIVDLLRLAALFEMINGHTLDAVLQDRLRTSDAFATFTWFRGLVSVSFMLASGLAFHLTTVSRFEKHKEGPAAARHRIRRALEIVAMGYVLRFPFEIFTGNAVSIQIGLARVMAVDVLHTIGFTLFFLELLVLALPRARHVQWTSAVLAVLAIALAPAGEALSMTHAWPVLTNYVGHAGGSLFPLLPWCAYIFLGVIVGGIALPEGAATPLRIYLSRLAGLTALAFAAWYAMRFAPSLWHHGLNHQSEPRLVVLKLGVVLGVVTLLAVAFARTPTLPRPLRILAGETLSMYAFHLVVLYWTALSVHARYGHTLGFGPSLAIAGALIVVTTAVGLGWNKQKELRARWRAEREREQPVGEAS